MRKATKYILTLMLGVTLLSGCMPEEHQMAPGSELRDEDGRIDGIDFDKDIQGEDASYYGFNS